MVPTSMHKMYGADLVRCFGALTGNWARHIPDCAERIKALIPTESNESLSFGLMPYQNDGFVLEQTGETCAVLSADDPTIIVRNPLTGHVAVAQLSIESLCGPFVSNERVAGVTILDIIHNLAASRQERARLQVYITCSIGNSRNAFLIRSIQQELQKQDITDLRWDRVSTFSDKDLCGSYLWHSRLRDPSARNLVLVTRYA